jgi:hypothetical protein
VHTIWPIGEIVARFAADQGVPLRLARNLGHTQSLPKRMFKHLLNHRLSRLAGATADYVGTPQDLRNAPPPDDGLLEIVAHPSQLGADFGDACLEQGESLSELLEQHLPGVPRVAYGVAGIAMEDHAESVE